MFKKLLNVGKGHSHHEKLQQQQQQQKNLFQLNEIKSYGFSHLCCLGYSTSLSLLAVGSKYGLVKVLGNASVEFSHQLEPGNSIRQIEFIDCRDNATGSANQQQATKQKGGSVAAESTNESAIDLGTPAKLVVLTDNGQIHLFELKTVKQQNFSDNTTQTDCVVNTQDCCRQPKDSQQAPQNQNVSEYTQLKRTAQLDYFKYKSDDDDRSKRITTLEVSADAQSVFVGTEGGNLYQVPLDKFEPIIEGQQVQQEETLQVVTGKTVIIAQQNSEESGAKHNPTGGIEDELKEEETTAVNLNDEPQIEEVNEPFDMIKFDENIAPQLGDEIKSKKQGAIESIKRHPASNGKLLLSYHRGLNVIYDVQAKSVEKYFYHSQVQLESSCFADQNGDIFYTSHRDGSYIKWDTRQGSQAKANEDFIGQPYGPYPCKPTPKIQACTGLVNDQLEDLVIFSGGMPRATYDDKNPVTLVRTDSEGKDSIKTVLDFTSKVLDFVVITRPRGNLGAGAKSTGGGKKNKHKQQQQQQLRNKPIAVALAILAEEEFVVIDLLNSESYLEFALPYLNCVHSSAITCNQHYSDISDELYDQLLAYNKQQLKGKQSANEWPITGGKVIDAPEVRTHDILITGHEDGSVDIWDVSDLSMRHLLHLSTARFFSTGDDDLVPIDGPDNKQEIIDKDASQGEAAVVANSNNSSHHEDSSSPWPPLKRVGRFDPYSDDTRLAIRRLSLCPQTGTLVVAGTGGQVLVFELKEEQSELESLKADDITLVNDQRFTWKGREKLSLRAGSHKFEPGYQLSSYVQIEPPVAATSLDLRSDWHLYAVGTSYGFVLYEYVNKHAVVNKCTLNVQDFAIVSGDHPGASAISRKKSFRKSLRESFRRLRRGRSQRNQQLVGGEQPSAKPPAFGRSVATTGVRALNAPSAGGTESAPVVHRNVYSTERQVEQKVELGSIIKCITLTSAVITNSASFKPTLWVGTNSGQVLVYAISLASEQKSVVASEQQQSQAAEQQPEAAANIISEPERPLTTARLAKEIQLKHRAPIIAIFTSPEAPHSSQVAETAHEGAKSIPEKQPSELLGSADKVQTPERKSQSETTNDPNSEGERAQTPQVAAPQQQVESSPKSPKKDKDVVQPRVLICSEEQFKVFNLPNLKPFCKFKLTAHEGLRAKKISITQFLKPASGNKQPTANSLSSSKSLQSFATQTSPPASPVPPVEGGSASNDETANGAVVKKAESNNNSLSTLNNNHTSAASAKELMNAKFGAKTSSVAPHGTATDKEHQLISEQDQQQADGGLFEPYMVCMSNQGDCAIYSVPDLKRQAQIQVCKREDVNGITSTILTNYGEGYYLKSSSNFLRFSISTQRVLRVLSVV